MNDSDQLSLFEEASPEEASPLAIAVPVLEVFDGDGFRTRIALCQLTGNPEHHTEKEAIIRCAFIDAPELKQRGGSEARQFLTALMGGRKVWLGIRMKMDTGKCVDRYGRIVAVVDDFTQECIPLVADTSLSGAQGRSMSAICGSTDEVAL